MLTHERIHLQQQLEMGIVPFYIWYIVEYAFRRAQRTHHHAYMVLAHEQEAYENDYNPRYLTERRSYSWLQFV